MSSKAAPQVVVIAGPNGAGKTSAAPALLREAVGIRGFVNADVIAQGLAGFDPSSAALKAGRVMLKRLDELAKGRENFAFESTLAGRSALRRLSHLSEVGYDVHLFYLWLPSADLAMVRIRLRVESGGHEVPENTVRRRFPKSLANFDKIRGIAKSWRLYDGSAVGGRPMIAEGGLAEPVSVMDEAKYQLFQRLVKEAK